MSKFLRMAGYAALFDKRDAGGDVIRKGAFARTLADRQSPLPLLWQHKADLRIGWVDLAEEDERGLRVVATLDNPDGGAAQALVTRHVSGLSFGYRAVAALRSTEGRELSEIDLFEVSLVTCPMQDGARVHLLA